MKTYKRSALEPAESMSFALSWRLWVLGVVLWVARHEAPILNPLALSVDTCGPRRNHSNESDAQGVPRGWTSFELDINGIG